MFTRAIGTLICVASLVVPAQLFARQQHMTISAFDFSFTSIDGAQLDLSDYRGKALLVVNTASRCGFTPQYTGLQTLWSDYRDKGLVVIGVPSDNFGGQELDSEAEVKQFCEVNFNIDFPMTAITQIKGESAHPFYKWAKKQVGMIGKPKWNFHKYLIGRDGQIIDWFGSSTSLDGEKIRHAVRDALAQNSPS